MSESIAMKMARASDQEWQQLVDWFKAREERNEPVPQWRRVVFGYRVVVDNACDPTKTFLDWKPGIIVPEVPVPEKEGVA